MLRFEFVQYGEFDDPEWEVTYDNDPDPIGWFKYSYGEWLFSPSEQWELDSETLIQLAFKLELINQSTKQQRILGFL